MSTVMETPKLSRSEQARVNGAKSHGPKTDEGKASSCKNAVVHGFYSIDIFMEGESEQDYIDLRNSQLLALKPTNEAELVMIGRLVAAIWKQRRVMRIEERELALSKDYASDSLKWSRVRSDVDREISHSWRDLHTYRQKVREALKFTVAQGLQQPPLVLPDLPPSPIQERMFVNVGDKHFIRNIDAVPNDVLRQENLDSESDVLAFRVNRTNPSEAEVEPEEEQETRQTTAYTQPKPENPGTAPRPQTSTVSKSFNDYSPRR